MRLLALAFLVAAALAPAAAAQADGAPALFRYADFGGGWMVRLGEPVEVPAARLASGDVTRDADGTVRLAFLTPFRAGVQRVAVTVRTDADDRATSLRFDYEPGYVFEVEAAGYVDALGPPQRTALPRGGEALVWDDGATRFKLVRTAAPAGDRAHSVLSDLGR